MIQRRIDDWNDAYANWPHIPGSERWPAAWSDPAAAFRDAIAGAGRARLDIAYGGRPRNRFDLFLPEGGPKGLVVFVHGGYWIRFDKDVFSHLAGGAVQRGFAVAMPGYTLCPDIRVSGIVAEIGAAIAAAAAMVAGPLHLAGHSAGGQLATRMVCTDSPLTPPLRERIVSTLSISGVHDLRPMLRTGNNDTIGLDAAEAAAQSPALLKPLPRTRLTCWVGGGERAEFIRQSALLANVWIGLGAATASVVEPDRHHFNIVDGLVEAGSPLTRALLGD